MEFIGQLLAALYTVVVLAYLLYVLWDRYGDTVRAWAASVGKARTEEATWLAAWRKRWAIQTEVDG